MTYPTSTRPRWKKSLLTIVWIATSALFTHLLLHPSVPDLVRSVISKPSRLVAESVEYGAHLAVFFIGTQFALICLEATSRLRRVVILSAASVTALVAEATQAWVPARTVDVFDALFNLLGVALAALAYCRMFSPTTAAAPQTTWARGAMSEIQIAARSTESSTGAVAWRTVVWMSRRSRCSHRPRIRPRG